MPDHDQKASCGEYFSAGPSPDCGFLLIMGHQLLLGFFIVIGIVCTILKLIQDIRHGVLLGHSYIQLLDFIAIIFNSVVGF